MLITGHVSNQNHPEDFRILSIYRLIVRHRFLSIDYAGLAVSSGTSSLPMKVREGMSNLERICLLPVLIFLGRIKVACVQPPALLRFLVLERACGCTQLPDKRVEMSDRN